MTTHGLRRRRAHTFFLLLVVLALAGMTATVASGQGGNTASLSGTVSDSSGAVMPGADVVARKNTTGAESRAVTDGEGRFTIPALEPGIYTVTISLSGFKTVVLPDVEVVTATPAMVRVALELGKIEETVTVAGATEIIQTQTSTVTTTLSTTAITKLPLPTRSSMDFLTSLPGIDTTGAGRNSTVMGLRQSATNITIDGVNVQDNYLKSTDGFFARISPRIDAVEEVTVSTANPGAESAGQGAVQVRFTTRSGTNQFKGSTYWYLRRPEWNTNYWFNQRDGVSKDKVKVNTYGFRVGGPVVIPGLFDGHDRAFFFFNYEEFRQPGSIKRDRTILSPGAQSGIFQYSGGQVNLYTLAAANGQTATPDPSVNAVLGAIRQSTGTTGTVAQLTDPNYQRFSFVNTSQGIRRYPTTRGDVNLTMNHRVGLSYYAQQYNSTPDTLNSVDPAFPGFVNHGDQYSMRWSVMGNWRGTFSARAVNELRLAATGGPVKFSKGIAASNFESQGGFGLNLNSAGNNVSNPYVGRNPQTRDAPTYLVEDTLNWLKGRHTVSMGGTWTQINFLLESGNVVPTIGFGVASADPANAMFNTTNFPGASSTDLTNARNLYAVLTGRVTAINGAALLNGSTGQYEYMGRATRLARMREAGFFVQDAWRVHPGLTVNGGVRYELQLPFTPLNAYFTRTTTPDDLYGVSGPGNLFRPGTLAGSTPAFVQFKKGEPSFNTDRNNIAPSIGFAWTPGSKQGLLGKLMGHESDFVIRGGYSRSFNREGMATFDGIYGANPGGSIDATRSTTLGNLGAVPLLLRNGNLGPPAFQPSPIYPMQGSITDSINVFDPNTEVPYTDSWNIGVQRAITNDMAIEVRYVGTRGRNGWANGGRNYNEFNIKENGFLDEFRLAQANLQANIKAGRGNTFAYTGAPGTSPLPVFLAHYNRLPASAAGNTASYTGTNWTNTTFLGYLSLMNPNPFGFASTNGTNGLLGNATFRGNALAAGLPANYFVVNPDFLGGAWMTTNDQLSSNYDAMQIELRRRLSKGFLFAGSYVFANAKLSSFYSFRDPAGDMVKSSDTLHQAVKFNWVYELPFGRGRHFGSGAGPVLERIIGGWDFSGSGRIQSGRYFNFGNLRLVGMSDAEFAKLFKVYKRQDAEGRTRIYMLPEDIITNTVKAFSVSATSPTGYGSLGAPTGRYIAPANGPDCIQVVAGDCAPRHHIVQGPWFGRYDMALAKRIGFAGSMFATVTVEALNVFDNINFTAANNAGIYPAINSGVFTGTTTANYEVQSAYRDINNTQDPGGRVLQLSLRFSW